MIAQVKTLIEQSEENQRRDFTVRMVDLAGNIETQRRVDLTSVRQQMRAAAGRDSALNCVSNVKCWVGWFQNEHGECTNMLRENLRHCIAGTALVLLAGSITFAQQPSEVDQVKARQRISMMEGVLERAVSNGADNMVRQMKAVMADAPMLTGVPEVRGFRLDGYGVFFDVEVPALRLPVTWPLRYMFRDNRETMGIVDELRAMMVESEPRQRERLAHGRSSARAAGTGPGGAARHGTDRRGHGRGRSAAAPPAGSVGVRRPGGTLHA